MALDLEEQEQLAKLKVWWNKYGNLFTWIIVIVLVVYSGWSGVKYYQKKQTQKSAILFEKIEDALNAGDAERVLRIIKDLKKKYNSTIYASMGSLLASKFLYDKKNYAEAKFHLNWIIKNSNFNEFSSIARIRLSSILLDEKAYDESLKLLDFKFTDQFKSLIFDKRGDLYYAKKNKEKAIKSYQIAFDNLELNSPMRQVIGLKLEALGSFDSSKN